MVVVDYNEMHLNYACFAAFKIQKKIERKTYPVHSTNSTLSPCFSFIAFDAESMRVHGLSH